ncbi:MAG: hypothetical protein E7497_04690 [Ruminococcus sp.]|nr:hypothetical protein [Ruminococcus sp.]
MLNQTKTETKPQNSLLKEDNKFEAFARIVISVLMIGIMGLLSLASLLHTTGMEIVHEGEGYDTIVNRLNVELESVIYYNDNLFANLFFLVICILVCFVLIPRLKKIPLWAEISFIGAWTIILGMIWINSSQTAPSEDSWRVTEAAWRFSKDNFDMMLEPYYKNYSYQLGYVFFNEMLIRLQGVFTEVENLLFLEAYNVIFLAATYIGIILINDRIFTDKRIRHLTVFLLAVSAQPIIFTVFLYGIIPGLMFAVYAIYFEIVYLQKNNIPCGIISIFCIAIAVMIKSNYLIALIAMLAIAFVKMFSRKKFIYDIIYIACAAIISMSISPAVVNHYEKKSGVDLGDSVPYVSWIAMGMSESHLAPGWYNYTKTVSNFEENNFDAEEASKDSVAYIKERIKYFRENPQYTNDFFYKKFVSQWNETSYQSIWNNEVRYQFKDKGKLSAWVCGEGENKVKDYMDIYAQLIFIAVLVGVVACLRNKNLLSVILPLNILGGFLYHLLAEAKSQYAIPYFILMMGFAAYGLCVAYDIFSKKYAENSTLARIFCFESSVETVPAAAAAENTEKNTESTENEDEKIADDSEDNETDEEADDDTSSYDVRV